MDTQPRYPGYFDRARKGLPPAGIPASRAISHQVPIVAPRLRDMNESDAKPEPDVEPIPLDSLAPELPDPWRTFWWFSVERVAGVSAGCPVAAPAGSRLPWEADYWCHEGDKIWTRVDRAKRRQPAVPMNKVATRSLFEGMEDLP